MNKEKLKGYLEKVKTALKKVSKKVWILIAVVVVLIAAGIAIFLNTRPYDTIVADATPQEAAAVVQWLEDQGVHNYRLVNGNTVLVPQGQGASLKAKLLVEQYSGNSTSFSGYFERVSALSTESDRNNAWLVALMEELANTVRRFENVQDAVVTINPGEDRSYVLYGNNVVEASAGVVLTMRDGKLLTTEQANAIRNYIAHSVASLKVENVKIEDTWGTNYDALTVSTANGETSSALKLRLEAEWSNLIHNHIMKVLVPMFGAENLGVAVNVIVEVGEMTIDDYSPNLPEDAQWSQIGGAGIIGSRVGSYTVLTGEEIIAGGLVGTPSNAELPIDVEQDPTRDDYTGKIQGDYSVIYDNPFTQTHTIKTAGYIADCTVSVSINSTTAGFVDTNAIRWSVATAAGIAPVVTETMTAEDYLSWKISVLNGPFYVKPIPIDPITPGPGPTTLLGIPLWVIIAAGAGLLLFVVLLVVILLLRKRKRRKAQAEAEAIEALLAAAMPQTAEQEGEPVGADVMELHTERSMELRQSIRDFVDENMEVAALLIKSWLKEDGEHA